ncbi:asparaginase domain-containing protein [Nocardia sp. NBC_00565]|uniref:asparaginase domain-containing protein n=1 Tax=Nocardia sp. NBC_00565 TaxID=2975993 RepID=UPI002E80A0FA|nr:asparaginase domain-containing protein [Nocardia sp. NBC_00565]WUC03317.1 asparaginase domain-containing protein [Nocardia sp. NBC_00565]
MSRRSLAVHILYTGGTFGMVDHGAGMRPRSGIGAEIADVIAQFEDDEGMSVEFRYAELDRVIDSADADPGTACRIAERVRSDIGSARPDGVIVIHGTDTMAYSGARIAFELREFAVPVVLTGAQIPLGHAGSDARDNLRLALNSIAAEPVPGTYIAFGSALHPAVRASKRACDDYDGFATVRELTPPPTPPVLPIARPRADASRPVGLFTVFPGMHADLLDAALRHYRGGIVLECYGSGTLPQHGSATIEVVRQATLRGTPVLVITQCGSGAIDLARYLPGRALLDAGAISGGDMTREAALAKLAHLVDAGFAGRELRHWLSTNLLGELANPVAAPPNSIPIQDTYLTWSR